MTQEIVVLADLSFLLEILNVQSAKEMKYATIVIGIVFLTWANWTTAQTTLGGFCNEFIFGCGQGVENPGASDRCECRETTHESIDIALLVFCPLQLVIDGIYPDCCPCVMNMTNWPSFTAYDSDSSDSSHSSDPTVTTKLPTCVNKQIFFSLVGLFKKNDELVSTLNNGCDGKSVLERYRPIYISVEICRLGQVTKVFSVVVSTATMTVMAVERYIAICHPLKARSYCTAKNARIAVSVGWILSIAISCLLIPVVVIKILALVLAAFVFCWGPATAFDTGLSLYIVSTPTTHQMYWGTLSFVLDTMAICDSFFNPLVHIIMSRQFRLQMRSWLCCKSSEKQRVLASLHKKNTSSTVSSAVA